MRVILGLGLALAPLLLAAWWWRRSRTARDIPIARAILIALAANGRDAVKEKSALLSVNLVREK